MALVGLWMGVGVGRVGRLLVVASVIGHFVGGEVDD